MKKIILIVGGIVVIAVLGRLGWAYYQVKSDEARVANAPVVDITTVPAPVQIDTVTQAIPVAVAPVIATATVKPSTNQVKSEVDRYGVELYTLKQGVTTVDKTIAMKMKIVYTKHNGGVNFKMTASDGTSGSGLLLIGLDFDPVDKYGTNLPQLKEGETIIEKMGSGAGVKIIYTRSKNEIERKVTETDTSGGVGTTTTTVDLDSKEKLIAGIKFMENKMATDCQGVSTKACTDNKTVLEGLKTICLPLKTNEDVGMCMIAVAMGAATGGTSGSWSLGQQ